MIDAQLIETYLLTQINHQSLVATKARRIKRAAQGRGVSDFGARRAHNVDAVVYGARACYIGGIDSTATVLSGQKFGIQVSGTMAHSFVMYYKDEYLAFKKYAEMYPDATVLLRCIKVRGTECDTHCKGCIGAYGKAIKGCSHRQR